MPWTSSAALFMDSRGAGRGITAIRVPSLAALETVPQQLQDVLSKLAWPQPNDVQASDATALPQYTAATHRGAAPAEPSGRSMPPPYPAAAEIAERRLQAPGVKQKVRNFVEICEKNIPVVRQCDVLALQAVRNFYGIPQNPSRPSGLDGLVSRLRYRTPLAREIKILERQIAGFEGLENKHLKISLRTESRTNKEGQTRVECFATLKYTKRTVIGIPGVLGYEASTQLDDEPTIPYFALQFDNNEVQDLLAHLEPSFASRGPGLFEHKGPGEFVRTADRGLALTGTRTHHVDFLLLHLWSQERGSLRSF